jgi:hypothetical protein
VLHCLFCRFRSRAVVRRSGRLLLRIVLHRDGCVAAAGSTLLAHVLCVSTLALTCSLTPARFDRSKTRRPREQGVPAAVGHHPDHGRRRRVGTSAFSLLCGQPVAMRSFALCFALYGPACFRWFLQIGVLLALAHYSCTLSFDQRRPSRVFCFPRSRMTGLQPREADRVQDQADARARRQRKVYQGLFLLPLVAPKCCFAESRVLSPLACSCCSASTARCCLLPVRAPL